MNRTTIIVFFLALLVFSSSSAQEVILNEEISASQEIPNWGPNRKYDGQIIVKYGMTIPQSEDQLKGWFSGNQNYSALYQFIVKQSNRLSVVSELGYNFDQFRFNPNVASPIDGKDYDKELLVNHSIEGLVKIRINFEQRRGAHLGNYIEVGYFGDTRLGSSHQVTIKGVEGLDLFKKQVSKQTGLPYLKRFSHGPIVQLGFNAFGVYYKHNLAKLMSAPLEGLALPSGILGIHFRLRN